jgi:hypothetical protein
MVSDPGVLRRHRLTPQGINGFLDRTARRNTIGVAATVAISLYVMLRGQTLDIGALVMTLVAMPLVYGILVVGYFRSLRRVRKALSSYEILAGADFLCLKEADTADLRLSRGDIQSAEESKYALFLKSAGRNRTMAILKRLEGYDELKQNVSEWLPVKAEPGSKRGLRLALSWLFYVCAGGAFLAVFLSSEPAVVVPFSMPAIALLVWSFWSLVRDRHSRRRAWIVLLPLFGVAAKLYLLFR